MSEELSVSDVIAASIEEVWLAFLDSEAHSAMTGGNAVISAGVGADFTAWDGYIQGTNLELERPRRILQAWRAQDFPGDAPHSTLEILFAERGGGTEVTFVHTNLPDGMGAGFTEGWMKHYLVPMKAYFAAKKKKTATATAKKKTATPKKKTATPKKKTASASPKKKAAKKPAKKAKKRA
jgi:uncharacterized protein YndB with AHSA1/START domain